MRICVVNPNTTASMTAKIGVAARAAASPGVDVSAVNPDFGPPSIEGYYDEAFSVPGLLAEIAKAPDADAFVIACFDDTGPRGGALRDRARRSSASARRRSTWRASSRTSSASSPPCRARSRRSSATSSNTASPRAAPAFAPPNVPVLALEEPGSDARRTIEAEIERALAEDGAEAIVLGCAGMTDLARDLERKAGVPVLDGVACAVGLAETLARARRSGRRSETPTRRRSPRTTPASSPCSRRGEPQRARPVQRLIRAL